MKYKNTKTGAIIDSPCIISGGDWIKYSEKTKEIVEVEEEIEEVEETVEEIEEIEEEEIEGMEGITVKEIKQELDAFGIKYNPRAKKQELYDLMIKGR
ncbi:MAG TPA: hypothetical protein GX707_17715 [Epulopiscium sp.]|nr:hypothetical protein [Candidatus Epulonipiscium sp.]